MGLMVSKEKRVLNSDLEYVKCFEGASSRTGEVSLLKGIGNVWADGLTLILQIWYCPCVKVCYGVPASSVNHIFNILKSELSELKYMFPMRVN